LADLKIKNAKIFLPTGLIDGELTVSGGKIEEISKTGLPEGNKILDAEDRLVIPGVIDGHGHFYDPKFLQREDFESGTKAASIGGVTTVISMPLDTPIIKPKEIEEAIKAGERNSIIDFSLHAGNMKEDSYRYVPEIIKKGIKTFKIFTCPPYSLDRSVIKRIMTIVKKEGGISFIHAEDKEIIEQKTEELRKSGRKDSIAHAESRPSEAEKRAVEKIVKDQKEIGCPVHLAHISSKDGVETVEKAKNGSGDITAETCPHFLVFSEKDLEKKGPYLRTNPPVKKKKDVAALWNHLSKGTIDIVTTDHAPGTREEKEIGKDDIWKSQIGVPGVETLLPILYSEGVNEGRISLRRLVETLCTNPAKRFGLYPRKGTIEEGTDADLTIIERKKTYRIEDENVHYKVGWTPYDGMEVQGVPITTISRGEIITKDRNILGKSGRGKFLSTSS